MIVDDIDGVAVMYGSGFVGLFFVGFLFVKVLSYVKKFLFVVVNYIEGYIYVNFIIYI